MEARMRSAFLALAFLAACATTPAPAAPTGPAAATSYLAGTKWRRIDDENANPHGATLEFTERGASGDTQCNRWFSSATHDGETLRFGNVGLTRRACQTAMQADTERNLLAVLEATRYAHYDRDALVLLDEQQHVIARFNSELPPLEDGQ
jgi:heat shock protein HslJ